MVGETLKHILCTRYWSFCFGVFHKWRHGLIGGGGQGFYDNNTKPSVIKYVTMGVGVKKCSILLDVIYELPLCTNWLLIFFSNLINLFFRSNFASLKMSNWSTAEGTLFYVSHYRKRAKSTWEERKASGIGSTSLR